MTHSVERPFKCDLCNQTSKTRANLLRHKQKHHNTKQVKKELECAICPKTFKTSNSYGYHMKVHTGEKDHKCDLCNYTCIREQGIRKHKLSVHYENHY